MLKGFLKTCCGLAAVAGGAWGIYYAEHRTAADQRLQRLEAQKQQLEVEKKELQTAVSRLTDEKRVAELIVEDQHYADEPAPAAQPVKNSTATEPAEPATQGAGDAPDSHRKLLTTLLFVEYARDGSTLPAREFTIEGNTAHIDAMVIKFERGFVAQNDALRGHSIALFCRLYGDGQAPDHAYLIDRPPGPPDFYRLSDGAPPSGKSDDADDPSATNASPPHAPLPRTSAAAAELARQAAFESELWKSFWRLADDKKYREDKGVRIATGQGVWGPFVPARVYTVTLEADGGLNLTSEPMQGIYREALRLHQARQEQ